MEEEKIQRLHDTLSKLRKGKGLGVSSHYNFGGPTSSDNGAVPIKEDEDGKLYRDDGLPVNALYSNFLKQGSYTKKNSALKYGDGRKIKRNFDDCRQKDGNDDNNNDENSSSDCSSRSVKRRKKEKKKALKKAEKMEAKKKAKLEEKKRLKIEARKIEKLAEKKSKKESKSLLLSSSETTQSETTQSETTQSEEEKKKVKKEKKKSKEEKTKSKKKKKKSIS